MIRTVGSCSRAARQTEASRSIDSEGSREPIKPILTYRTPQLAAPVAARAAIPGRLGASPIAALTGTPGGAVSYTHLRAHETDSYLVCRLLLEKKKKNKKKKVI